MKLPKLKKAIDMRLRRSGQYNHDSFSSIFTDYKILRGEAFQQIGHALGYEDPREARGAGYQSTIERFDPDMSTEDALELARSIVAGWNWGQQTP